MPVGVGGGMGSVDLEPSGTRKTRPGRCVGGRVAADGGGNGGWSVKTVVRRRRVERKADREEGCPLDRGEHSDHCLGRAAGPTGRERVSSCRNVLS